LEGPIATDVMEDLDDAELASLARLMAPDEIVELLDTWLLGVTCS